MSASNQYIDYRHQPVPSDTVVIDLSDRIERLLSYEDIAETLTADEENKLVDYVKNLMQMSYNRVSRRYEYWTEADRAHDVWVPPNTTEFREKAVVADTRAIADTVLTYQMAAITGRNPMFQLEGQNRSSRTAAAVLERILHMHTRRSAGEAKLAQMFLDGIRYGFAPTKVVWRDDLKRNDIINFNPRRVFPDPRVQWGDWENWQYVAFVSYSSYASLVQTGLYPKLKRYPQLRFQQPGISAGWDVHRWQQEEGRGFSVDPSDPYVTEDQGDQYFSLGHARVVDEVWLKLSGWEINVPQIETIWIVLAIMDEKVCIRFQANPYGRQFPVVVGSLFHDAHKTFAQGLYDVIMPLHEVATWLLRSRVDNVQAAMNNLIFVDEGKVNIADLMDRNPWGVVRTMEGTNPGDGVYVAEVPDVTRNHWGDIAALSDMKQRISAASDAQQGVPTADVRSATEIARLTQLGSQRLGVLSRIISATTVRPMVRMMVENIQDSMAFSGSIKMDPYNTPSTLVPMVDDEYLDFDVSDLQGSVEYLVVDGTLPIEPTRNAETWINMLQVLGNTGLNMEYKMGMIAEEAIRSMGVPDLERFRISKEEREREGMSPSQQMAMMEKVRGASVQPQDEVLREAERGNLVPLSTARQESARR